MCGHVTFPLGVVHPVTSSTGDGDASGGTAGDATGIMGHRAQLVATRV